MESDFEAALARVRRANEHRETLWELAAEHLANHPINKRFDIGEHEVRVLVSASARFPLRMSVIFSEWLHNLRSALDATLYELAVHDTGQDPPTQAGRRQFPVVTSPEQLRGPALAGLSRQTLDAISAMQPYHHTGGAIGSGLWWLHELARIDRHRRHHAIAWRFVELDVDADPGIFTQPTRICSHDLAFLREGEELELAAYTLRTGDRQHTRDHPIDVNHRIEFDIPEWVERAHPGFRWRIDDRMRAIEWVVGASIEQFQSMLSATE
ncbi:hypothetical protein [Gordonia polyisoprenivorans]|uniref:hypothetical protein n=1 Tax=Gordonia polyisoprenivorans TaxID=84595 RepID=UPI00230109F2|nr:hypothetical protein [Gordonia polyisoprenivorans]WCB36932.1 hypothetical protein PHA63_23230 [Gordonia polyisoprenivorans]